MVLLGKSAFRLLQPHQAQYPADKGTCCDDVKELGWRHEGEDSEVYHRSNIAVGTRNAGNLADKAALDGRNDAKGSALRALYKEVKTVMATATRVIRGSRSRNMVMVCARASLAFLEPS